MNKFNGAAEKNDETANDTAALTTTTTTDAANLSIFFDPQEDISRSIDFIPDDVNFSIPPQFLLDGQFDISLLNGQQVPSAAADGGGGSNCSLAPQQLQYPPEQPLVQLIAPPPYEEECLSSVPSYMPLTSSTPSCSILDHTTIGNYLPPGNLPLPLPLPAENSGIFTGGAMFPPQELDFQGENGRFFCPDTISRVYNFSNDLQVPSLIIPNQHFLNFIHHFKI